MEKQGEIFDEEGKYSSGEAARLEAELGIEFVKPLSSAVSRTTSEVRSHLSIDDPDDPRSDEYWHEHPHTD